MQRSRRSVRRPIRWACLVAVALVVTAVPTAASVATRAKGPCALLKKREIAQVFFAPVGKRTKTKPGPACRWKVAGGLGVAGGGEVVTLVDRGRSVASAFALAGQFDGGHVEEIADLGKAAQYLPTLDTVFVVVNDKTLVSVQSVFPASPSTTTSAGTRSPVSGSSHRDQLVALARLAVRRV